MGQTPLLDEGRVVGCANITVATAVGFLHGADLDVHPLAVREPRRVGAH